MELVATLRAAEHQAGCEYRDESVALDELRGAVAHEDARERDDAGLGSRERVVARNGENGLAEQPADGGAGRGTDGDAVDDVASEPLEHPATLFKTVHGDREAEQHEREREAVVEPGLRREHEAGRLLAALERRADL